MTTADIGAGLERLAAFPGALQQRLEGLSDAALRFRPAPDEWSVVEVVGHLCDAEALWGGRVCQMLRSERPAFPPFDQDAMVAQQRYQEQQVAALLSTLSERRAKHIAFLRELHPSQFECDGIHPIRGLVTVSSTLLRLPNHDQLHLNQIEANLKAFEATGIAG